MTTPAYSTEDLIATLGTEELIFAIRQLSDCFKPKAKERAMAWLHGESVRLGGHAGTNVVPIRNSERRLRMALALRAVLAVADE